jgi:hypothetical protein
MFNCPHCGKLAITVLKKAILGPGVPVTCQSCGKNLKITYPAWLKAALPGTAVMVAAWFIESKALMYGVSLVGLALMIGLHLIWVPLVKEQ